MKGSFQLSVNKFFLTEIFHTSASYKVEDKPLSLQPTKI